MIGDLLHGAIGPLEMDSMVLAPTGVRLDSGCATESTT